MAAGAAETVREVLGGITSVPEEVRDYAADTAVSLLDDLQDEDAAAIATELQDSIGPLLEGVPETEVEAMCVKIARAFKGLAENGGDEAAAGEASENYVVKCDNIILAYAGKSLLRSSTLRLVRGRRYGIVGQNGVGKTTLLTRIDAGDIANFPKDIKVVFVRHEILANDDSDVLQYMKAANAGSKTEGEVRRVLADVGFTDDLLKNSVLELSGGWRMKLALAGALLSSADLLLLDEPTNHLDVASVAWLAQYLRTLTDTTVVIVSHDYEFLNNVITDVVHFVDHQLSYYPDGWESFAAAMPHVIKALPQKKNCSYFAKITGEIDALIKFPDPGQLDGVKSRLKPVAWLKDVSFTYPGSDKRILDQVSVKLCMASRVALLGRNGAGKTTLLKLLVGDLDGTGQANMGEVIYLQSPCLLLLLSLSLSLSLCARRVSLSLSLTFSLRACVACAWCLSLLACYVCLLVLTCMHIRKHTQVWKHQNLRVSYIAQHSMHHLEDNLLLNPITYIQKRFFQGRDKELAKMAMVGMTEADHAAMAKKGNIREIVGRAVRGKSLCYQVRKSSG